jgi:hypothetical protein
LFPSKPMSLSWVAALLRWLSAQQADGSGRRPWLWRAHWRRVSMTRPHTPVSRQRRKEP